MNNGVLRTVGLFFIGSFSAGLATMLLNMGSDKYALPTPLYFGLAGGAGGVTWVLLSRHLGLVKSTAGYLLASTASAVVAGVVLLQFGHSFGDPFVDPDLNDYFSTVIGFGVGGLTYGFLHRKFNRLET